MGAVFTGNITKAAVNAFILVDLSDVMIIYIEVFPMGDFLNRFANEIIYGSKTFFIHPVIQSFAHIFNNPETVFHGGCAYLYIGCPKQHKFHRIPPGAYSANTGNRTAGSGFTAGPQ